MKIKLLILILVLLLSPLMPCYADGEISVGGQNPDGHIWQDEGISLRQRPYVNITGSAATCSDTGGKTVCDFTGGGATGTSGWTDQGTYIELTTQTDSVTIGTGTTPASRLEVNGMITSSGGLTTAAGITAQTATIGGNTISGTNTGDQSLWATVSATPHGTTTANSTTDTLTIATETGQTARISGDTLTLGNALRLDQILDLNTSKTFGMGTSSIKFSFPNTTALEAFEIDGTGNFGKDLVHIHQHTGNPTTGNIAVFEWDDKDMGGVKIYADAADDASGADVIGLTITTNDNDDSDYVPLRIADDRSSDDDTLFQIDYTGTVEVGIWKGTVVAHEYGGLEADVNAYSGLVGINSGSTSEVDTETELETHLGGLNVVTATGNDITSAALANLVDDETGSGKVVFNNGATMTSLTVATSIGLPAGAVDAITEIDSTLKSGADATLVTGTKGSTSEIAMWNADGDLVDNNVILGTMTDGRWCSYSTSGTLISCDQAAPGGAQSLWATISAGDHGETTADSTTDTLIIATTTGLTAVISGDTLTLGNNYIPPFTFVIETPTAADEFTLPKMLRAITLTDIECIVDNGYGEAGDTCTIDIRECDSASGSCVTVDAPIICDYDGASDDGSFSNPTIDAGDG